METTSAPAAGDAITVQERWHGGLWSVLPHLVVSAQDSYVTYLPAGTTGTYASSIGVPGRDHLPRAERKLLALETCVYRIVERTAPFSTLHFFTLGSHARVSLGWTPTGDFMGWYVNFELPPVLGDDGVRTMDLVLDIVVRPDRTWEWKDRSDFDVAVRRGLLDPAFLPVLEDEAERVLAEAEAGAGAFDDAWPVWEPDPAWARPELPPGFGIDGHRWTKRPIRRGPLRPGAVA